MDRPPPTASATILLLGLNALVWLGFAVFTVLGGIPSIPEGMFRGLMALMALGASAVLASLVIGLRRRSRLAFYGALAVLAAIAVLSITDQVGLLDLVSLSISVIPLVLLVRDRRWYLRQPETGG
jgi:lysylphosphatidylglycerol synthetase-like protein (DUF2156 family)